MLSDLEQTTLSAWRNVEERLTPPIAADTANSVVGQAIMPVMPMQVEQMLFRVANSTYLSPISPLICV